MIVNEKDVSKLSEKDLHTLLVVYKGMAIRIESEIENRKQRFEVIEGVSSYSIFDRKLEVEIKLINYDKDFADFHDEDLDDYMNNYLKKLLTLLNDNKHSI
jgi:hypothetical protein